MGRRGRKSSLKFYRGKQLFREACHTSVVWRHTLRFINMEVEVHLLVEEHGLPGAYAIHFHYYFRECSLVYSVLMSGIEERPSCRMLFFLRHLYKNLPRPTVMVHLQNISSSASFCCLQQAVSMSSLCEDHCQWFKVLKGGMSHKFSWPRCPDAPNLVKAILHHDS